MRKHFLIFFILLVSLSHVYSYTVDPSLAGYSFLKDDYTESSPRSMAMGGVSIISIEPREAFYNNPAKLSDVEKLSFWIPSANANLYGAFDAIKDGTAKKIIEALREKDKTGMAAALFTYFFNSNLGRNDFGGIDVNLGAIWKGIGLRADFSESINTFKPVEIEEGVYSNYSRLMNAKLSAGYGHKIKLKGDWCFDLGASVTFDFIKIRTVDTADIITEVYEKESFDYKKFLANLPNIRGFSFPVNIGTTLSIPGNFKAAIVVRNIFGTHFMRNTTKSETVSYKYNNGIKFDLGTAWIWTKNKIIQVAVEADLKDMASSFGSGRKFLKNFHVGTEVGFWNMVFLRGGVNSGYLTAGVGVSFKIFKADFAYYHKENGDEYGDRSQECLTIRVAFGWM